LPTETSPAAGAAYPEFGDLKEQNGDENPARFLWFCGRSLNPLAAAVVRGIESVGRANAWIVAEKRLGDHLDAAPRDRILDQLERRRDLLLVRDGAPAPETFSECHDVDLETTPFKGETETPVGDTPAPVSVASDGGAEATEPAIDAATTDREAADGPFCPVCQAALDEEAVAGQTGLWCRECGAFRGRIEDGEPVVETPDPDADQFESAADEDPADRRASDQRGLEGWSA